MKRSIVLTLGVCLVLFGAGMLVGFKAEAPAENFEYMQVTTLESVIPGGVGRSRMITTNSDGSQKDEKMKNLFSMAGLNVGDIKKNESQIVEMITRNVSDGWELERIVSGSFSKGQGIFLTRYLFRRVR